MSDPKGCMFIFITFISVGLMFLVPWAFEKLLRWGYENDLFAVGIVLGLLLIGIRLFWEFGLKDLFK